MVRLRFGLVRLRLGKGAAMRLQQIMLSGQCAANQESVINIPRYPIFRRWQSSRTLAVLSGTVRRHALIGKSAKLRVVTSIVFARQPQNSLVQAVCTIALTPSADPPIICCSLLDYWISMAKDNITHPCDYEHICCMA